MKTFIKRGICYLFRVFNAKAEVVLYSALPLLDVSEISIDKFIDIDETSFYLKSITTNYGRSHTTRQTRYLVAHYSITYRRVDVLHSNLTFKITSN